MRKQQPASFLIDVVTLFKAFVSVPPSEQSFVQQLDFEKGS